VREGVTTTEMWRDPGWRVTERAMGMRKNLAVAKKKNLSRSKKLKNGRHRGGCGEGRRAETT